MATDYAALTAKEAKEAAITEASTAEELDEMWAAWERCGWSKEGLIYAAVLERKQELGAELADEDAARVEAAKLKRKHGAALPPIKGKMPR